MFDVITIGNALWDSFFILDGVEGCALDKAKKRLQLTYGAKIPILHTVQSVGGNAANVAVGLARLNKTVALITEIGKDFYGDLIIKELKKTKVETKFVLQKSGATTYSVILNYKAERTILNSTNVRDYKLANLPPAKFVYFTSVGAAFGTIQPRLEKYLRAHSDTKLVFNPGVYQLHTGLNSVKSLIKKTEILFLNLEEAQMLAGQKLSNKLSAEKLHALGAKIVVITDGNRGATAFDGTKHCTQPIFKVKVVAKTGAGDAFASGFLAKYLANGDILESLKWGSANAAGVVQHFGAQTGLLNEMEMKQLIK